jgi:hypothetical protein
MHCLLAVAYKRDVAFDTNVLSNLLDIDSSNYPYMFVLRYMPFERINFAFNSLSLNASTKYHD